MSIIISGIKISLNDKEEQAVKSALKILNVKEKNAVASVYKKSLDLRRNNIGQVISIIVDLDKDEEKIIKRLNRNDVRYIAPVKMPEISATE